MRITSTNLLNKSYRIYSECAKLYNGGKAGKTKIERPAYKNVFFKNKLYYFYLDKSTIYYINVGTLICVHNVRSWVKRVFSDTTSDLNTNNSNINIVSFQ